MRARVTKIGNSQGFRIPKPVLEQTGIKDDIEIEVDKDQIIIRPVTKVRDGWDAAFKKMAQYDVTAKSHFCSHRRQRSEVRGPQ